jgi:hypothetical protein
VAVNKYFQRNFASPNEQRLAEDIIVESIKIQGVDVQYLPRAAYNRDSLLGEDPLSQFNLAVPIEVYINNVQNFEGEGDLLTKFGLEIRDSLTMTMAIRRWDQIRTETIMDEVGYNYQVETANTQAFGRELSDSYTLETGSANGYSIASSRPREGDLIFVPFINNSNGAIYEVKFVENEKIFYQHGKQYTYELKCELFRYSSERIDTGNTLIDTIETRYTTDMLVFQYTLENGDTLVDESSGYIIQEFELSTQASGANNSLLLNLVDREDYIDFSEHNPFSEVDRF